MVSEAHPRKQRVAVPGFGCGATGRRNAATRGCLRTLVELAFFVTTRYSMCNYLILQVFVARGKPTAHPREQREAVPGFG
ncbi:hypothetical protein [Vreelandella neptunia]|uniref:Uncharacterized protein n=1 Tax=Vreelandella neptunia TaxID=115551 RepID=A0ABS9S1K5_9GAMM|nr:hypothetical protein [Halomonas neptunia]MCH4809980.1 hypothetical protein [Halomonas neptunia]